MKDERYREIMEEMGMPNRQYLLSALKQVALEVSQEADEKTLSIVDECFHVFAPTSIADAMEMAEDLL